MKMRIYPFLILFYLLFNLSAFAAQYDIKEMTPEVSQALESRQGRFQQLQNLKAAGSVGENNQGYAQAMNDTVPTAIVVDAENTDRRKIYETIVKQNKLGADGMKLVQEAFATVQRERARPGDWIQSPSGDWSQK